jgi:Novel STAND NTPase 1
MHSPKALPTLLDPYIGLRPYTDSDDDRARFFGREQDQEIIIANLYAASLTVFYGASGVGKSSVLMAGVVPELRQTPRFACIVFRTWQSEKVLPALKAAILTAVQVAAKKEINVDAALQLDDFLLQCAQAFRGHIVLIFDQFEEYFLYHAASGVSEGFDAEFARSVNRSEIDASFLLSMREDSLSKLDRFQGRIPKLLTNLLRLDHLDRDAAIRAIREPLAACNERLPPGVPPSSIDDDLVEALLDQAKTGSVALDHAKQPAPPVASATPVNSETWIETPVLQVVLTRLWDEEKKHGSHQLRLATLKNLGGAPKILRTHLDRTMRKLKWRERRIAADIFGYLVTPSGGKIAHTVSDLASYSRCRKSRLALLLERLADSKIRVLRTIPPPPGEPEGVRYEIFHDVLAAAILTWRRRQFVWRRVWRVACWVLGLSAVFYAFAAVVLFSAVKVRKFVEAGQIHREKAKADLVNQTNPIKDVTALRNLSLALTYNRQDTEAAKMARDLLLQRIWCPPAAPEARYEQDALLAATFAPRGSNNEVFAAAGDGQLLFWNGRKLSPVRSLFEKPKPTEREVMQPGFASFSPDGRWLLIIPPRLASAAIAEVASQGPPQQTGVGGRADSSHEPCKLQIWRWSMQNQTYEPTGEDLEIQRLRGSRINFAWSNESDRLVIVNARGTNEAECAFFQVEGTFRELVDRSRRLTDMKIVALAFATYHSGIAAVSVEPAGLLRKVTLFSFSADYLQVIPVSGEDSIPLSEGFLPNGIAFGPGNDEITLTSWSSVRILNIRDGKVTPIPPPTFRDQFMRLVVGPGDYATRLVATSLYGRVHVAKSARRQEPAEPVVFRGSIGIPQFSSDGQRLLILSGGLWNVFDTIRLIDVSALYRTRDGAPETVEQKPAPPWLAEIAGAVSGLDTSGDGSLLTLETVRQRYPESKAGDAYESVWKRFFPEERAGH